MPTRSTLKQIVFKHVIVMLSIVVGLLSWRPVQAAEDAYAAIRERLDDCSVCHGENGASTNPEIPVLAGQEMYYLYVQLKDFKAGHRANTIMQTVAGTMSKSEMKAVATYFSKQEWPNIGFNADPAKATKGETAASSGQCVACHLGNYHGASRIPRLAGQHPQYLLKTMMDFKHHERLNSPAVAALLAAFGDDDLINMAEYIGNM